MSKGTIITVIWLGVDETGGDLDEILTNPVSEVQVNHRLATVLGARHVSYERFQEIVLNDLPSVDSLPSVRIPLDRPSPLPSVGQILCLPSI